jgi:hypothetical protein
MKPRCSAFDFATFQSMMLVGETAGATDARGVESQAARSPRTNLGER